jgi:uncharacterized protein YegP (UPF0339 family)
MHVHKPKFEVYLARDDSYRWRLKAGNGEIVATSEGYTRRDDAHRSARNVKAIAGGADIVDL